MTDIVEKLFSQVGDDVQQAYDYDALFKDAAIEIEALRNSLREQGAQFLDVKPNPDRPDPKANPTAYLKSTQDEFNKSEFRNVTVQLFWTPDWPIVEAKWKVRDESVTVSHPCLWETPDHIALYLVDRMREAVAAAVRRELT